MALNKISGDWDEDLLAQLLEDLRVDDTIDELLSGFDADEIDALLDGTGYDVSEDDYGDEFELANGERGEIQKMTVNLHRNQLEFIRSCIERVYENDEVHETFGNTNRNGNGIYEVMRQWAEQKKSS